MLQRNVVMSQKLAGKVAVVTGASKGIGAQIARQLAADGAAVVVNYASSRAGADKVVADIAKAGGKAVAVQADVAKPEDIKRLFAETKKAFDRVDILVNNAGIYQFAPLEEITPELFHKMFDLNVLGLLLTTQEAVKHMGAEGGSIVNIGSVAGKVGFPGSAVYGATKAAVDLITRTLSLELGPRKIRVNAVNPGMIQTEGTHSSGIDDSDMAAQTKVETPLGRIGQPDDIATVVSFMVSSDAKWITGEGVYVAGGWS